MVIQPNGGIIVGGQVDVTDAAGEAPSADFALARYTTTGALDSTFGSGGTVLTGIKPSSGTSTAGIAAIALDAQGRLIAVGNVSENPAPGMVVARYLTQ